MSTKVLGDLIIETKESRHNVVRPCDIPFRFGRSVGRFGKHETEAAAARLVAFFQSHGYWCAFYITTFRTFCEKKLPATVAPLNPKALDDLLYGLTGWWFDDGTMTYIYAGDHYIMLMPDGQCAVTKAFIKACCEK